MCTIGRVCMPVAVMAHDAGDGACGKDGPKMAHIANMMMRIKA